MATTDGSQNTGDTRNERALLMRLVIEHAAPADVPAIWALQRIAFEVEAMRYDDWSIPPLTQTLEALADEFREFTVLKAVAEGQLVGSIRARVNRDVGEIGRLMVHPSFQRRGIGARLLQAIEGACVLTQRKPAQVRT